MILSLKNIYRLLTGQDFPMYSSPAIPARSRKGLTLVGFWQENLLYEFRNGKYGKQIWRNTGGRNRFISDICNRSERLRFYREYAEELEHAATPEVFLRQVEQFMLFLRERTYSEKALQRRLHVFLEQAAAEDPCFPDGLYELLTESSLVEVRPESGLPAAETALFRSAWQISFLMLYALSGIEMNSAGMLRIQKKEFGIHALWSLYSSRISKGNVRFLTGMNSELCAEPLALQHFFGREEELFGLRDCLEHGGCYLVSGMGGVGKTELARQFLRICEKEQLADIIAVVQYDGSLLESLMRAFHIPSVGDADDNLHNCLSRIREWEGSRVLIMVDNMNHTIEEDPSLASLQTLPGTIVVTSRLSELPGFQIYPVNPPLKNTAELIFRDNYRRAFSAEDYRFMDQMLENIQLCHPLIMKLLGQGAAANGWSVRELDTRLGIRLSGFACGSGTPEAFSQNAALSTDIRSAKGRSAEFQLRRIYQEMYSLWEVRAEQKQLLRLFALFPYESYELPFLQVVLSGYPMGEQPLSEHLDALYRLGWLEKRGGRYGMHPFIAECVQPDTVSEQELAPFYTAVFHTENDTDERFINDAGPKTDIRQAALARMIVHIAGHLTGTVSLLFLRRTLVAMTCMQRQWGVSPQAEQTMASLLAHCPEAGDRERILYYSAKLVITPEDIHTLREIYDRQMSGQSLHPADQFLLCLTLGKGLAASGNMDAVPLLERALETSSSDLQKMEVCHVCAQFYTLIGDLRQEIRWCEEGYALCAKPENEQPLVSFQLATLLCGIYITQHRTEEAQEILTSTEKKIQAMNIPCIRIPCLAVKAQLAIVTGNPADGAGIFKEVLKMTEVYNGEREGLWYSFRQDMGTAYRLDGQYEEAERCYRECVDFWRLAGNSYQVLALQNNIGALYQNWGKLTEAAETLRQAYHAAEQMKDDRERGIIAGNLSKVLHELGDSSGEYFYLKEACPLLDQFYGPQDPTSTAARERLSRINKKEGESKGEKKG